MLLFRFLSLFFLFVCFLEEVFLNFSHGLESPSKNSPLDPKPKYKLNSQLDLQRSRKLKILPKSM